MWKQCFTLIREKGLPKELWAIVRDLWEIRLARLVHRLDDVAEEELDAALADETPPNSELSDDDIRAPDTEADLPRRPRKVKTASDSPKLIDTLRSTTSGSFS